MRKVSKAAICAAINVLSVIGTFAIVIVLADWQFGPSNDLQVLGIAINTHARYFGIIALSCVLRMLEIALNDIGGPILGFSVYNPSTREIYGFTYWQIFWLTNIMWAANNFGNVFKTLLLVSRLDIALFSVIFGEIVSMCIVAHLLGEKQFIPDKDYSEDSDISELSEVIVN